MNIALIAAMTNQGVIGYQNKLPWHFPEELKYFKKITLGKPIIMGRKTFESMGKRPLPGRKNIILTQSKDFIAEGCRVVDSLEQAIEEALKGDPGSQNSQPSENEKKLAEIMVIGGAQIYAQFLPLANRLYITFVHQEFPGDTYFPKVQWADWELVSTEAHNDYTIKVFNKRL